MRSSRVSSMTTMRRSAGLSRPSVCTIVVLPDPVAPSSRIKRTSIFNMSLTSFLSNIEFPPEEESVNLGRSPP